MSVKHVVILNLDMYLFQFTNKRINILNQIVKNDFIFNFFFLAGNIFRIQSTCDPFSIFGNKQQQIKITASQIGNE